MAFNPKGKTILCISAHPDDLDFCFGGSIAKWAKEGANIYYLILTDGSKGSQDQSIKTEELIKIRQGEQKEAGKILGIKDVFFLDFVDGELQNHPDVRKEVVRHIRRLKPDAVATLDPSFIYDEENGVVNHPDHRTAGQIALDCTYPFSRNHRTMPELLEEGLMPHTVSDIFLFNGQKMNFFMDIEDSFDKKMEALSCHKSQFPDTGALEKIIRTFALSIGKKAQTNLAEGFIHIHLSF